MRQKPKATAKPKTITTATTSIDGVPVEVRRHPGARRMILRVSRAKGSVIVTVPTRCNMDDAGVFLNRHLDWVRDRLDHLPVPVPFCDGTVIPVRGVPHRIVFVGSAPGQVSVQQRKGAGGPCLDVVSSQDRAPNYLKAWLASQARNDLDERVRFHCATLGLRAKRIAVRDQISRWGSCSTTGVLSFSWRLILAPPVVLDYVAAHEVCHLAQMNHGPKFWALVRSVTPRMNEAKAWLQAHGTELHRFGSDRKP